MHLCVYEYNTTTLTIGIENGNSETVDLSCLEDGVGITSAQASAITANTAKTRITSSQASAITANTAKTGITSSQASAITANTAKVGMTLGTTSSTALAGDALSGDVQIGNSSTDKIGFFGATAVVRSGIGSADATDVEMLQWSDAYMTRGLSYDNVKVVRRDLVKAMDTNRTKINELIQKLQELGLINQSLERESPPLKRVGFILNDVKCCNYVQFQSRQQSAQVESLSKALADSRPSSLYL